MLVKEYTEEFCKLNIRVAHVEEDAEKVARYINDLRYEIHNEIGILPLKTDENAYQVSWKAKEKTAKKQSQRGRQKKAYKKQMKSKQARGHFNLQEKRAEVPMEVHREEVIQEEGDHFPKAKVKVETICPNAIDVEN